MRMWMANPSFMCRKHLLGEHYELHMIVGAIEKGKNIDGYISRHLIFPNYIDIRHYHLIREMASRGYNHRSFLIPPIQKYAQAKFWMYREDIHDPLFSRCKECAMLYKLSQA